MRRRGKTRMIAFILGMVLLAEATILYAHSGGTDKYGCHAGSKPYHCHGGGGGSGGGDGNLLLAAAVTLVLVGLLVQHKVQAKDQARVETWRGLRVAPNAVSFTYDATLPFLQSAKPRIAAELGSIYSLYTGQVLADLKQTQTRRHRAGHPRARPPCRQSVPLACRYPIWRGGLAGVYPVEAELIQP